MLVKMAGLVVFALCCRVDDLASVVDKLLAASSNAEREQILTGASPELYRTCRDRAKSLFDEYKYEPARAAYLAAQAVALRLKDNAEVARCDHRIAAQRGRVRGVASPRCSVASAIDNGRTRNPPRRLYMARRNRKCGTPVDGAPSAATETVHQPRSSTPSSSQNMDEAWA